MLDEGAAFPDTRGVMKTEKRCCTCREVKPLDAFHRHRSQKDGRQNACKDCQRERQRHYRQTAEGREVSRRGSRRYGRSERGKAVRAAWEERGGWIEAELRRIRGGVNNAIRTGKLVRLDYCEECGHDGSECVIHAHHDNYCRPLDVRFLCSRCHRAWHRHNDPILPHRPLPA